MSEVQGDPRRTNAYRATVEVNRKLVAALEQLADAQRLTDVPQPLRDAIHELATQAAQVQGVCEWLVEDLIKLRNP